MRNKFRYMTALLVAAVVAAVWHFCGASAGVVMAVGFAGMSETDVAELGKAMLSLKSQLEGRIGDIKKIPDLEKTFGEFQIELSRMKKIFAARGVAGGSGGARPRGGVSSEAARAFGAHVVLGMTMKGLMDNVPDRDLLIREARGAFNIEQKAALTTGDIALPTEYTQELRELVSEYGVCRKMMTPYPIGRGTSKPARLGTQNDFTFPIAMSGAITEKNVQLGNASLESHKGGGLIRIPREIDEQGIIPLGQMLARYAARKFAKVEDTIGFLGDGTAPYDSIKGVCQIAADNNKVVQLGATKTAPSDATLENWRALRPLTPSPVLATGAYYAHPTWERRFRTFKTQADPMIYVQNGPGGFATLDGYPIIWSEILAPYAETANAGAYIGVFGDLSYWWFGEHGSPRTDFSTDVFFTTDELAIRWLEEIDFDYAAPDCAAALKTAAA